MIVIMNDVVLCSFVFTMLPFLILFTEISTFPFVVSELHFEEEAAL